MTIHSEFWAARRRTYTGRVILRSARDSHRQRCYDWENASLRPIQTAFADRQAAKGYARLCMKVALRLLLSLHPDKANEALMRASFKAAFTKERLSKCNANASGAYFAAWGWTDAIIAHEVAHWADQWDHKLSGGSGFSVAYEGHGPKWRGWFVYILSNAGMRSTGQGEAVSKLMLETLSAARLAVTLPERAH